MITITKEQFVKFSLSAHTVEKLPNDFVASFVDSSKAYTLRTVNLKNMASIEQEGQIRQVSYDFTAFQTVETVFKQLYKAMKSNSYPKAALSFTVSILTGNSINIGDIIAVENTDFSINTEFRIIKKTNNSIVDNTIEFDAVQYTANKFDSAYINSGGSSWIPQNTTLVPLVKFKVIPLPFNEAYQYKTAYLILANREIGIETGIQVFISVDGTNYEYLNTLYNYSQNGTLAAAYGSTNDLDNSANGILYTPYKEDLTFNSVTRQNLFAVTRYAIVEDELIAFQDFNPDGNVNIRITNLIRGLTYSKQASHADGVDIWLSDVTAGNTLQISRTSVFYLKLVPFSDTDAEDVANATAITVTPTFTAKQPYKPARVEATRVGSDIHIKVYPILKMFDGAGRLAEDAYSDVYPFSYSGSIRYQIGTGAFINVGNVSEFDISNANAIIVNINQVQYSYISDVISVSVGTADGIYIGR